MDRLRMARRPLRGSLTRTVNEVEAELAAQNPEPKELRKKSLKIDEILTQLEDYDSKILDSLLNGGATDAEYEMECVAIEEYRDKARDVKVEIDVVLQPRRSPSPPSSSSWYDSANSSVAKKRNFKLPKIQLRTFNGELTEWLSWWSQFCKIHEDEELHATDKFQYLSQCMAKGTRAAELVNSYPQTEENYPKAIKALQERFGKEKLLIQVYVRELLKMVIGNAKSKDKLQLSSMFDKLESFMRALESLNVPAEQMARFLYPMVESSLPEEVMIAWQRSPFYGKDGAQEHPPRSELDYLMEFLKQEVECEGQRSLAKSGFGVVESKGDQSREKMKTVKTGLPTAASLYTGQGNYGCIFCDKHGHASSGCFKAQKMDLQERRQHVKKKRVCFQCLNPGHFSSSCNKKVTCKECGGGHYAIMCPGPASAQGKNSGMSSVPPAVKGMGAEQSASNSNHCRASQLVLMKTVRVMLHGRNGKKKLVRLLFDEGSQRSYIKTATANELNCQVIKKFSMQNTLFGGQVTGLRTKSCHRVETGPTDGSMKMNLDLINEDMICGTCPKVPCGPWLTELAKRRIVLPDAQSKSTEVEVLIGSDLWGSLMTGNMVKLDCGLIAVESVFGWTLSGVIEGSARQSNYAGAVISLLTCEERSVPKLWLLDTIGIKDPAENVTEEEHNLAVKQSVFSGITREGRYVVKLPWISDEAKLSLPGNRAVAESRLNRTTEKLKQQQQLDVYHQVFQDWQKEGIIEAVDEDDNDGHILCHRPVFKPGSSTTPVRPVFDASCKVGKYPSLNQCLEKGPNELELIPSILLRFREKAVGAVADIRKAFLMVSLAKEDRNYQKFLWWEDATAKKLKVYRVCRVVFGLNCGPFLLAAALDYHLKNVPHDKKALADVLGRSIYVDNCVVSLDSHEEYEEFKLAATEILAEAQMDLRQWSCSGDLRCDSGEIQENVLGLVWIKVKDTLSCKINKNEDQNVVVTKRNVLATIARMFDPIGITSPALLVPKLMLQESWSVEQGWDVEWGQKETEAFKTWIAELSALGKIQIPRMAFGGNGNVQIHTFTDASKKAYAAVVFARTECDGNVIIFGVEHNEAETPQNCKDAVHSVIESVVGVGNVPKIESSHRIGKKRKNGNGKPRPIRVVLNSRQDKDMVLKNRKVLCGIKDLQEVFLSRDLTINQQNKRKEARRASEPKLAMNHELATDPCIQTKRGSNHERPKGSPMPPHSKAKDNVKKTEAELAAERRASIMTTLAHWPPAKAEDRADKLMAFEAELTPEMRAKCEDLSVLTTEFLAKGRRYPINNGGGSLRGGGGSLFLY